MFVTSFDHEDQKIVIDADTKEKVADLVKDYFGLFIYPCTTKVAFEPMADAEYVEVWPINPENALCAFLLYEV